MCSNPIWKQGAVPRGNDVPWRAAACHSRCSATQQLATACCRRCSERLDFVLSLQGVRSKAGWVRFVWVQCSSMLGPQQGMHT